MHEPRDKGGKSKCWENGEVIRTGGKVRRRGKGEKEGKMGREEEGTTMKG